MKYYEAIGIETDEVTGRTTVPKGLFTENERNNRFPSLSDNAFEVKFISRKRIVFSDGCRFDGSKGKLRERRQYTKLACAAIAERKREEVENERMMADLIRFANAAKTVVEFIGDPVFVKALETV